VGYEVLGLLAFCRHLRKLEKYLQFANFEKNPRELQTCASTKSAKRLEGNTHKTNIHIKTRYHTMQEKNT